MESEPAVGRRTRSPGSVGARRARTTLSPLGPGGCPHNSTLGRRASFGSVVPVPGSRRHPERETILAALDDPQPDRVELRGVLLVEVAWLGPKGLAWRRRPRS